jgi:hypothetical protein
MNLVKVRIPSVEGRWVADVSPLEEKSIMFSKKAGLKL